ncbi:ABC-three component system middle component 6 [Verrucomicrobiaceae bacterium 227]
MILNQDIKPEKQAYYLGSRILSVLKDEPSEQVQLLNVFEQVNRTEKVSYHAFSMAMNWLYLIGAVELDERTLIKCF